MNYNKIHGPSVLTHLSNLPYDRFDALFTDATRADKNFEIVYVAQETFEDGWSPHVIVFRTTNPEYVPKRGRQPSVVAETVTTKMFVYIEEIALSDGKVKYHAHCIQPNA